MTGGLYTSPILKVQFLWFPLDYFCSREDIICNPDIAANFSAPAYGYPAENSRAGIYYNIILNKWVAGDALYGITLLIHQIRFQG